MSASLPKRRVFIGIKVSDELVEVCTQLQHECADLPARFAKQDDLHLTLVPPFDMTDQGQVDAVIKPIMYHTDPFILHLKKLEYGPTPRKPRLAWIECEPAPELVALRQALVDAFDYQDRYDFRPHVTLARFKDQDRHVLKNRPIEKEVDRSMKVTSVELFESVHRGGITYRMLGSYRFAL